MFVLLFFCLMLCSLFGVAHAVPVQWQMGTQEAVTPVMEKLVEFHNFLLYLIFGISIFVLALLIYVIFRFHHKKNPIPSKCSHNTTIEVVWTVVPLIIVGMILVPSIKILYYEEVIPESEMTLKVVGHQWYWHYDYEGADGGAISFDSYIKPDSDLKDDEYRLLEVDNRVFLPVDTNIRVLITGADVIHSWAVPPFGVKVDAVPGRLNETWVNIKKEGVYYGQCSELCGVNHGFMSIAVEAVSKDKFDKWYKEAKKKFAS